MINTPIINNKITMTGQLTAKVQSEKDPRIQYDVDVTGPDKCTCKAYEFNGNCKHINWVKRKIGIKDEFQ